MKTVYIYFTALLFSSSFAISAQTIHIKLLDANTNKPVANVKVKSAHDHDLITFSNDSGYFAFNLKHTDTILFQKDYYYPLYMSMALHNFDSTHTISIKLTPSATIYTSSNTFDKANLQMFEYQFTHNEVGEESNAQVTLFQTNEAIKAQQVQTDKPFKIVSVDVFTHPKNKSQYTQTPHEN